MKKSLFICVGSVLVVLLITCANTGSAVGSGGFIVSFNTHGGNAIPPVQSVDGAVETPDDPVRAGYVFAGWYTSIQTRLKQ
jgi:hypothetical protein